MDNIENATSDRGETERLLREDELDTVTGGIIIEWAGNDASAGHDGTGYRAFVCVFIA
jgi:hypothetical protein